MKGRRFTQLACLLLAAVLVLWLAAPAMADTSRSLSERPCCFEVFRSNA